MNGDLATLYWPDALITIGLDRNRSVLPTIGLVAQHPSELRALARAALVGGEYDEFVAAATELEGRTWAAALLRCVTVEWPWHGEWFAWYSAFLRGRRLRRPWSREAAAVIRRQVPPLDAAFLEDLERTTEPGWEAQLRAGHDDDWTPYQAAWELVVKRAVWAAWRDLEEAVPVSDLEELVAWATNLPGGPSGPPTLPPAEPV